jgi:hypothetical protein
VETMELIMPTFDQMTGGSQYLVSDMELSKQDFDVIAQASSKNKFLQRKYTDKKPYVIDKVKKQTIFSHFVQNKN